MTDYTSRSLRDLQRDYLDSSTDAMPIGGLIAWSALAAAAFILRDALPVWAVFTAAASPFLLALVIDRVRGRRSILANDDGQPMLQLFGRFIVVVGLLSGFVIIAASEARETDLLILGMALLAGMIWVPHGWAADDPAGLIHFILRAVFCYAAYLFAPEEIRGAAIAGAAALTYVYAIAAMKKPARG